MKELSNTEMRQERAIVALLSEPSIEAAAKTADVSDVTIWRWMKQPAFRVKLRDARRAVVEGAIGRLQQTATEAVETLRRNLTCGTPSVEVRAATAILDQATRAVELFDVVERLEQLEARLAARADGRHE
jgi:transposase